MSSKTPGGSAPRRVLDENEEALPPQSDSAHFAVDADTSSDGPQADTAGDGERTARTGKRAAGAGRRTTFAKSVGWTVLSTVVPPVGLIRAGNKALGWSLLGITAGLVAGVGYVAITNRSGLVADVASLVNVRNLTIAGALIGAVALVWVAIIGHTYLKTRPSKLRIVQRIGGSLLVSVLAFAVAAPAAVAVRYTYDTASLLDSVFSDGGKSATRPSSTATNKADPWNGRLNVLILGGDSGFSRDESLGARTDTVIVASIDTKTGDTVLLSLPRNTAKMPFPEDSPLAEYYPNGFYDGSDPDNAEYMLNAMYHNVPNTVGKDVLGETDNVGADVLKLSTGEALGLEIDYYVMINLDGFKDLIDALGGITVNVNYRIPRGGSTDKGIPPDSYIEPGPNQHLNGTDALWYARGRYGLDDFSRMERQRCVISAVAKQADPVNVLRRYEAITKAGKQIITTDIPSNMLPDLLTVATKVQKADNMQSIVFKHGYNGFSSRYPDWDLVRSQVQTAIKTASGDSSSTAKPSASASSTSPTASSPTSSTPTSQSSASASSSSSSDGPAVDTADACAYHPKQ